MRVIFEDEDLLVVSKPAGMNTHAPAPFAGEGIYEWFRDREPCWSTLAIVHRLDKETSGVLVFGKTTRANRSLTDQFTRHCIRKVYLLLTDRAVKRGPFTIASSLARAGEKYVSRRPGMGGERAETRFHARPDLSTAFPGMTMVEAAPVTGRTHQIRVHAAETGFPILGDTLYGGSAAARVFLHSAALTLEHPATGREMTFESAPAFEVDARMNLRRAFVDSAETDAYRLIHGASDTWPGWYVDRLGGFLLSQAEEPLNDAQEAELARLMNVCGATGAYHKTLDRRVRSSGPQDASPQLLIGGSATGPFTIRENGVRFELSFNEGYSVGLFLDQRDNRRRLLTGHVAAGFSSLGHYARVASSSSEGTGTELHRPLLNRGGEGEESGIAGSVARGGFSDDRIANVFPGPSSPQSSPPSIPQEEREETPPHLPGHVADFSGVGAAPAEVLNVFAYTCGFSVCAARAGARVTSLDLSKKYLEWGRRNFALNGLDPAAHEFIYGDAFDWLNRLGKKQRVFDVIILDPPTFSQSKAGGKFQAEKDFGRLVRAALPLLKANGVLLASTNAARWEPDLFLAAITAAVQGANRKITQQHYSPQPPDFPVTRAEPAYLKTVWLRIS